MISVVCVLCKAKSFTRSRETGPGQKSEQCRKVLKSLLRMEERWLGETQEDS